MRPFRLNIKDTIRDFFKRHFIKITFLLIFFITGIIIGIITIAKYVEIFDVEKMVYTFLKNRLRENLSKFSVFFGLFFKYLLLFLICLASSFSKFTRWLSFVVFAYLGYIFGNIFAFVIIIYSSGGILNLILFLVPFTLFILTCFLIFVSLSWHHGCQCEKFGFRHNFYLHIFIGFLICLLLTCIIFSLFCPVIILGML